MEIYPEYFLLVYDCTVLHYCSENDIKKRAWKPQISTSQDDEMDVPFSYSEVLYLSHACIFLLLLICLRNTVKMENSIDEMNYQVSEEQNESRGERQVPFFQ